MKKSIAALFAVSSLLAACTSNESKQDEVMCVNVAQAVDLDMAEPLNYTGRTKSAEEVSVAFRVSGTVSNVTVKEGDRVQKGQMIAKMDSRDYETQLAATTAEYAQIKADVERVVALYNEGNTTAQMYDQARYGLEQITQKLNNHRDQLADTKLVSPVSGYVKTLYHHGGETVGAGMPVMLISASDDVEVEIHLSAQDYAKRDEHSSYYCKFDITGDQKFPLVLSRTSKEANANQLYTMRLRLADGYDRKLITPGMTTIVYVQMESNGSGEVNIPSTAIFNDADVTKVYLYDNSTKSVSLKNVEVKSINRDGSATISRGLRHGDIVVSTGVHHIVDGQKVEILKPSSKRNVGGLL